MQGCQFIFRPCHSEMCLLQEQVDSLQSDLEALRQKDRDRVAQFKDKARKQVILYSCTKVKGWLAQGLLPGLQQRKHCVESLQVGMPCRCCLDSPLVAEWKE